MKTFAKNFFALVSTTILISGCGQQRVANMASTLSQTPSILAFAGSPQSLSQGQSSTLNWNVFGASVVTIDNGIGNVDSQSGSAQISPQQTTIYTLYATNGSGTTSTQITISVNTPPPNPTINSFTASPAQINAGSASTLSWGTSNATAVNITPGVGNVALSGTVQVYPTQTTTYTITASNSVGQVTSNVSVTVTQPTATPTPTPQPTATPTPNPSATPTPKPSATPSPMLAFISQPVTMTAGACSAAMTIQAQDSSGHPVVQSAALSLTLAYNTNLINKLQAAPQGYSDSACANALPGEGRMTMPGHSGTGVATIAAGQSSVTIYMVARTSVYMQLVAMDQSQPQVYSEGYQVEPVTATSPVGFHVAGPDTLGLNTCSHPFFARALDPYSNSANVTSPVTMQLQGLGSAVAYSDSGCTTPIAGNKIVLQNSSQIWGTDGGPSSDVPFYLKDSVSENIAITASISGSSLPLLYGVNVWTTALANPGQPPILPQRHISIPARPSLTGANVVNVPSGGDLQAALNKATPGTVIVLQAGTTYTHTGGFVLPAISNPNGQYITITSSNLASLPAQGVRVGIADAVNMPKIVSGNPDAILAAMPGNLSQGVLPSSYYRIIGVEFAIDPSTTLQYGIVNLGSPTANGPKPAQDADMANHIYIESSYVHGDPVGQTTSTADVQHCIAMPGAWEAVVDSYVSNCHYVGQDAQAIGSRGPGPYRIANNYLEGSTENVLFGGALAFYPNELSTDVEIVHNWFNKPLSWNPNDTVNFKCVTRNNQCLHWTAKNLFEIKEGRRFLIDGNTFTNNWADAQVGDALLITPRSTGIDWFIIAEDLTYTNNIIAHSMNGFDFSVNDSVAPAHSQLTSRVLLQNNAGWDFGDPNWGKTTTSYLLLTGSFDGFTLNHNTFGFSNAAQFWEGAPGNGTGVAPVGVNISNNIVTGGKYCFHGQGNFSGITNFTMANNAFIGCKASQLPPALQPQNYYPTDPTAVGFTTWSADAPTNNTDVLSLTGSSPYHGLLQGDPVGADLGVNWATLLQHVQ